MGIGSVCKRLGLRHQVVVLNRRYLSAAIIIGCCLSASAGFARDGANQAGLTAYPDFAQACLAFTTGYGLAAGDNTPRPPTLGRQRGQCGSQHKPLVFSVTHENSANNHKDSANYDQKIRSYMADYDYDADMGRWVSADLVGNPKAPTLVLALDTVNFRKQNVTGWPLQYGHLFAGINDLSVSAPLAQPITVEFDLRISADVKPRLYKGYSGQRILLGALADWAEAPPRSNRAHFIEFDFSQAAGYSQSYGDPVRPLCQDIAYDRCFYDVDGKYAEGRELSFAAQPYATRLKKRGWTHIRIPLSQAIQALHWVSPPKTWDEAALKGLYLAIESEGATRTKLEIKGYRVYGGGL